ncbi:histidine kinase [Propioniciclava soli]|uniref:sensor histidine kinase n=1 Tax=Propioniciclava soli TaxID=2775081 RepID=UPI001E49D084|nr:histidine kinase [Propioniciclava soli]
MWNSPARQPDLHPRDRSDAGIDRKDAAARRGRAALPRPLRAMRWVLIAVALVDLTSTLSTHAASGVGAPVAVPIALSSTLAVVTTVFRPKLGVLLSAIPLASTFVVILGQGVLPLLVGILVMTAVGSRRAVLLTLTAYLAHTVAVGLRTQPSTFGLSIALVLGVVAVGLVTRALIARSHRVQDDIARLQRETERIARDERAALADELSTLLTDGLADQQRVLGRSLAAPDAAGMHGALAGIEASSREALAQLRGLVSTLRGRPSDDPADGGGEPTDLVMVAEEAEDLLVGHGHPVALEIARPPEGAGDFSSDLLANALRAAVPLVASHAPAGVECTLRLAHTPDAAVLEISHPSLDEPAPLTTPLRSVQQRVEATGGAMDLTTDGGLWRLRVTLPTRPVAASAAPRDSLRHLLRRRKLDEVLQWGALLPLTAATVLVAAEAITLHQQHAPWHTTALWALVLLGTTASVWRWWLGIGVQVAVLVLSLLWARADVLAGQPAQASLVVLTALAVIRDTRWGWVMAGGWLLYTAAWFGGVDPRLMTLSLVDPGLGVIIGLVMQYFLRLRTHQLGQLRDETLRHDEARDSVRKELAGELHDIVAHQLSLITMQVGAHARESDPSAVRNTLERVATINRSAQADLALLLHVMRAEPASADAAPADADAAWLTPTRAAHAAAATLRDAGRQVSVDVDPAVDLTDPSTQKTLTRIIREAATNILRYSAAGASCSLRATRDDAHLELTITNALPATPLRSDHSTGFGLLGLDERVRLTGGTLTAGPVGQSWQVRAMLPTRLHVDPSPRPPEDSGVRRPAAA